MTSASAAWPGIKQLPSSRKRWSRTIRRRWIFYRTRWRLEISSRAPLDPFFERKLSTGRCAVHALFRKRFKLLASRNGKSWRTKLRTSWRERKTDLQPIIKDGFELEISALKSEQPFTIRRQKLRNFNRESLETLVESMTRAANLHNTAPTRPTTRASSRIDAIRANPVFYISPISRGESIFEGLGECNLFDWAASLITIFCAYYRGDVKEHLKKSFGPAKLMHIFIFTVW